MFRQITTCSVLLMASTFAATLADTRLLDAVKSENVTSVRTALAQGADISATDPDGSTALHWAAQRNNEEIAAALLAAGAKPDVKTRFNVTRRFRWRP
ncbi:MAG: ankyrin repeat domain-containing protein [Acidobacteriota bacterium]